MSFPSYERYKDSGVEWLGKVPEHWRVNSLKQLASLVTGTTPRTEIESNYQDEQGFPWVRPDDLDDAGKPVSATRFLSAEGSGVVREVYPESTLICCIGSIGKLGFVKSKCSTNQQITAAHFRSNGRFYFFLLNAARPELENLATGNVLKILNAERLGRLSVVSPPSAEAELIALFLDQQTAKIDALIEEQRRLIALLKEKRQAIISHAVTKGVNPAAPMKDSGVKWLGCIPQDWQLVRIGQLFRQVQEFGDESLPILSVSIHDGVSDRQLDESELERKVTRSEDLTKYKRVSPGDLTYNMMRAWQGGFGTVCVEGMVSPAYVVARPRDFCCTDFVESLLRTPAAVEELRRYSKGVTDFRLRLYWEEFKSIAMALPPPQEIEKITSEIARVRLESDALTRVSESAILLLKERRSALISGAVTGKIDVRNYALSSAPAPEELYELA